MAKASAPRPRDESEFVVDDDTGDVVRKPGAEETTQRFTVTFRGKTLDLAMNDLGPGDDEVARRQARRTISGVWMNAAATGILDLADLFLLVWFARRKNGQSGLTYAQMEKDYPSYAEFLADIDMESVKLDDGASDPES